MPASNNPSIVVRKVSKTYTVAKDGSEHGIKLGRRGIHVEALLSTSFVAYKGESVGIIGRNGSGKSTLLNMVAGHELPTTGKIWASAQPSLLSVGAALQPHLTGMENVRLGLLASGLSPQHVAEIQDSVGEWAEIGDAIHRPLNTYSSGMGARLKFSIATAVQPKILLIDEALSTGDSTFAQRATERMNEFLAGDSTVFIVSHAPGVIQDNCQRAIWIHEGQTVADGDSDAVCRQYKRWSDAEAKRDRITAGKILRRAANDYQVPKLVLDSEAAAFFDSDKCNNDGFSFRRQRRHKHRS